VIPAAFEYERPSSVDEAVAALGRHGDDAKLLAGGHSLLPLMKLRLATPSVLVDIGRLQDLAYVRTEGDEVRIGALTKHCDVEASDVLREAAPLLAHVAGQVGDPQVRHRGTIGGSLAHGDPASDLPAALLALRGSLVANGPGGERVIAADDFFTGFLETALAPDEVLTEIRVPVTAGAGWSFQKFNRRAQDWAIVGVAAVLGGVGVGAPAGNGGVGVGTPAGDGGAGVGAPAGNGSAAGIGLVNMASAPVRAAGAEAALGSGASAADAAARADEGLDPPADLNATAEYRRHLARVLTRRAIQEAGG
jgi:carbon-monoxide dehydrogenase medium subunit